MLSCTISFWYNFSDSSCCHYSLTIVRKRWVSLLIIFKGCYHWVSSSTILKKIPQSSCEPSSFYKVQFVSMHEGLLLCSCTKQFKQTNSINEKKKRKRRCHSIYGRRKLLFISSFLSHLLYSPPIKHGFSDALVPPNHCSLGSSGPLGYYHYKY